VSRQAQETPRRFPWLCPPALHQPIWSPNWPSALPERAGDEYLAYERDGEWTLASGVCAFIELDSDEMRVIPDGVVQREAWSGRPGSVLGEAIDRLLLETSRLFGWVAFEFGTYRYGLQQQLQPGTPLARIFWPRAQFVVTESQVQLIGADDHHVDALQRVLATGVPDLRSATGVDVRKDTAGYRRRVATAIGEITAGRYQKVILSRWISRPPTGWAAAITPRRGRFCCVSEDSAPLATVPNLSPPSATTASW
jgi:salicylate synthetase